MINVTVDIPQDYFRFIEKKMNKNADEALKEAARLACQKLAIATFPIGISGKTHESLKKAIYKDMNRAYIVSDSDNAYDDGSYLARHRTTSRRRVPEGTERMGISRANYEDLKSKLEKRSGMAKAGWLQAAQQLGNTRIPAWLRKPEDLASVQKVGSTIIVTNKVRYASSLITDGQIRNAMTSAFRGLLKRAERMTK